MGTSVYGRAMAKRTTASKTATWFESMPAAVREYPFGPQAAVFKVGGKMFGLLASDERSMTVKADPDEGAALRSQFEAVRPGYHMNKKHWITVDLGEAGRDVPVQDLIEDSYDLVVASLSRKLRVHLGLLADVPTKTERDGSAPNT